MATRGQSPLRMYAQLLEVVVCDKRLWNWLRVLDRYPMVRVTTEVDTVMSDTFQNKFIWFGSCEAISSEAISMSLGRSGTFSNGVTLRICNIACKDRFRFNRLTPRATRIYTATAIQIWLLT